MAKFVKPLVACFTIYGCTFSQLRNSFKKTLFNEIIKLGRGPLMFWSVVPAEEFRAPSFLWYFEEFCAIQMFYFGTQLIMNL